MDITEIVKREYSEVDSSSILDGTVVEIVSGGKKHLYRMVNDKLYIIFSAREELLETSGVHIDKFNRIIRLANRDKNIETLTADL